MSGVPALADALTEPTDRFRVIAHPADIKLPPAGARAHAPRLAPC
jgi:hypothetical protein